MITDKYSSNFYFSDLQFNTFLERNKTNLNKSLGKGNFSDYLFKCNKLPYYISKIRIIKFQKWIVVYFYLYNYSKKTFLNNFNFLNLFKFTRKNSIYFLNKKSNFLFDF